MKAIARLLVIFGLALVALVAPANAWSQAVETWVEQWDPASRQWVRVAEGADRRVTPRMTIEARAIAAYGPFRVFSEARLS